jgi:opacity protein-like surface antigen
MATSGFSFCVSRTCEIACLWCNVTLAVSSLVTAQSVEGSLALPKGFGVHSGYSKQEEKQMRVWSVMLAVVLLALAAIAASAAPVYPTFDGSTGVVTLPTAEVAPQGNINLAIDYQKPPGEETVWVARVNGGIAENAELWFGYLWWDWPGGQEKIWNAVAKYRFLNQEKNNVDVAIGGSFGKDDWEWDTMDVTKAFLAISKDFKTGTSSPVVARGTVGVMYNHFKEGDWTDNFTKPYVALEFMGEEGWNLGLEYRWKDNEWDDEEAPFSAVLRYMFPDAPVWVEVGTVKCQMRPLR